jgi:predicted dienelactone hydrolase
MVLAPTLAPIFGTRGSTNTAMGNFQKPGQLDRLVDAAMREMRRTGALSSSAKIGQIVLAGHSAGGKPMQAVIGAKNRLGASVRECWGFECLYFGSGVWSQWLNADPQRRFVHFRRKSQMQAPTAALAKCANFKDTSGGKDHCRIVEQYWESAVRELGSRSPGGAGDRELPFEDEAELELEREAIRSEAFLPLFPDFNKIRQLMERNEYVPKTGAPATKQGIKSKVEVLGYKYHDVTFAQGTLLHRRVVEVANASGMDPGFLAANLVAESGPSTWSKTSGRVASEVLGLDDWFDPATANYIRAAIAAAPALNFSYDDVRATGEQWDTSTEKAGGALKPRGTVDATKAVAAVAMYMKGQELMMQRVINNNARRFPYLLKSMYDLPVEKRFTLQRHMFNAGIGAAFKFFQDLSRGADIPRSGGITRDPKNPRRTAVLHMARAIHLSQAVFGKSPLEYWPKPDTSPLEEPESFRARFP